MPLFVIVGVLSGSTHGFVVWAGQPIDLHDPLRVRRMGRKIKLFLSITMYNENADELQRSLKGVAEQLDQLQPHVTWEEMAVAIIVDGRNKMHKSMIEYCTKELKIFDEGLLRLKYNGSEVSCHIFEISVELPKHKAQREYYQPLQLILCIKERNGGKLNSHLWFFSGFCKQLQPEYTFVRCHACGFVVAHFGRLVWFVV